MMDIGLIHRREYEIEEDRTENLVIAEAPGRIHYLGEHGEPKAGLYLSSAIDRYVQVAVSIRKDNSLRFYAANLGERKRTTLVNLKFKREDRWANYIKVAIHLFADLGYPVKGLNFTVAGNIPQQVGLASSSAIESAAVMALKGFFRANISEKDLLSRLLSSKTLFFGAQSNSVDYQIAFSARKDQFLLVDEANVSVKRIKSPLSKYKLLVMDSRVPKMGADEEIRQRVSDIKKGLKLLTNRKDGSSFRDFAANDLIESMGNLPEEIRRRCLHVVQEIRRVQDAGESLRRNDLASFTRIISHSHESLRDLYEVSCPEIDWLVKRAQELHGVLASRMTGQGFGGCTYTFIREDMVEEYRKRLEDYERIFGFHPVIYEMKLSSGTRLVSEAGRNLGEEKEGKPSLKIVEKKAPEKKVADKKLERSAAR
ncbi:MAG: galactokinase [Treponema sp.]|nr:galactokinase [Treponema sp.]